MIGKAIGKLKNLHELQLFYLENEFNDHKELYSGMKDVKNLKMLSLTFENHFKSEEEMAAVIGFLTQ